MSDVMKIKTEDLIFFMAEDLSSYVSTFMAGQDANLILEFQLAPSGMSSLVIKMDFLAEARGCGQQEDCHCADLRSRIPGAQEDDDIMANIVQHNCPVRRIVTTGRHFICEVKVGSSVEELDKGVSLNAAPHLLSRVAHDLASGHVPPGLLRFSPLFSDLAKALDSASALVMVSPDGIRHFSFWHDTRPDIDRTPMQSRTIH